MKTEIFPSRERHPSIIRNISDLAKADQEEWGQNWQNPEFTESFPNLIPDILNLNEEARKSIYKEGLTTFTKLSESQKRTFITNNVFRINTDTTPPSWEKTPSTRVSQNEKLLSEN